MSQKVLIGFKAPPAVKQRLEDLAYANRTSVSAIILQLVYDRLAQEDEL